MRHAGSVALGQSRWSCGFLPTMGVCPGMWARTGGRRAGVSARPPPSPSRKDRRPVAAGPKETPTPDPDPRRRFVKIRRSARPTQKAAGWNIAQPAPALAKHGHQFRIRIVLIGVGQACVHAFANEQGRADVEVPDEAVPFGMPPWSGPPARPTSDAFVARNGPPLKYSPVCPVIRPLAPASSPPNRAGCRTTAFGSAFASRTVVMPARIWSASSFDPSYSTVATPPPGPASVDDAVEVLAQAVTGQDLILDAGDARRTPSGSERSRRALARRPAAGAGCLRPVRDGLRGHGRVACSGMSGLRLQRAFRGFERRVEAGVRTGRRRGSFLRRTRTPARPSVAVGMRSRIVRAPSELRHDPVRRCVRAASGQVRIGAALAAMRPPAPQVPDSIWATSSLAVWIGPRLIDRSAVSCAPSARGSGSSPDRSATTPRRGAADPAIWESSVSSSSWAMDSRRLGLLPKRPGRRGGPGCRPRPG